MRFWWAFAQAVKLTKRGGHTPQEDAWVQEKAKGFEVLCRSALADCRLLDSEECIQEASFQMIEDSEEQRANHGLTGFRNMLLASWAHGILKKRNGGNKKYVTRFCCLVLFRDLSLS